MCVRSEFSNCTPLHALCYHDLRHGMQADHVCKVQGEGNYLVHGRGAAIKRLVYSTNSKRGVCHGLNCYQITLLKCTPSMMLRARSFLLRSCWLHVVTGCGWVQDIKLVVVSDRNHYPLAPEPGFLTRGDRLLQ